MRVAPPQRRTRDSRSAPRMAAREVVRRPATAQRAEGLATRAAVRVSRGETGVRDLGRAPAALMPGVPSLGSPLPADLLARLESGFDADLSAVRLHTDVAAADASERHGARAFAAGRDIYFGRDARADLRSARGFETLAHEVAHVLQQTGQTDRSGRDAARAVAGSAGADVQRKDLVEDVDQYEGYFDAERPEYDDVKKAYDKVPGVDTEIKELNKIYTINFTWASAGDHDKLVARTKLPAFESLSNDVKAFYVDCLKAVKRYADAAAIFKKLPPTTSTIFRSKEMYLELRKDMSWIGPLARTHPFTKQLYPWSIVDVFHHYFFGPVQALILPLDDYWKKSFAERKRIGAQTGRKDSEPVLMVLHSIDRLVASQQDALASFGEATKADRPDEEKLKIADAYATRKPDDPEIGASAATEPEVHALYEDIWPEVQKRAERARAFWKRIKTLRDAVFAGFRFESLTEADVKTLAQDVGTTPAFATLDDVFVKIASLLVNVEPLPAPNTYRDRVEAQREVLRRQAGNYGARLIDLARSTKLKKEDERLTLQLGLVVRLLLEARQALTARYDNAADVTLTKQGHDDERLAARIRIANLTWALAEVLGLAHAKAATDVFYNIDKPRLALLSNWVPDSKAVGPMDLVGEDSHGTGLGATLVSRFFFGDYLNAIAAAIETALDPAKNPRLLQGPMPGILGEALRTVKAIDRPMRYVMAKHEFWYSAAGAVKTVKGEKVVDPTKQFHALVLGHWRTLTLKASFGDKAAFYTSPSPPHPSEAAIVLYVVPRLDRVVKRLMLIPELDDQVKEYRKKPFKGLVKIVPFEEWAAWLQDLEELAEELREAKQTKKLSEPATTALDADWQKAKQRYYHAARRATEFQIRPLLERYSDNERDNADVPARVFDLMEQLALATQIEDQLKDEIKLDQPVQATLLLLELADDVSKAFALKNLRWAYGVAGTLLRYTTGAVAMWNDPAFQPEIRKNKLPDVTDADLDKAAATLTKMRDALAASVRSGQESRGLKGRVGSPGEVGTIELYPSMEEGQGFGIYLRQWTLLHVHTNFDFLPGYGGIESLGIKWPHPAAERAGDDLVVDASAGPNQGARLSPTTKLLTMERRTLQPSPRKGSKTPPPEPPPWTTLEITAADLPTLTRLYLDYGDWSGLEYIRVAGEAVEWIVKAELELAEFIPGVGQGIMVGRFIASVISFLESDEFDQLVTAFKEEGLSAIPNLVRKVAALLSPSAAKIFGWFFFGRPTMIEAPAHKTSRMEDQQRKASSGGVWAKLARVIRNVVHFAKRLLGTVEGLRNKAQAPFRAAQSFVLSHPGLALVISFIVKYFDTLTDLVTSVLFEEPDEQKDTDFATRLKDAVRGGITGFAERITKAVNVIREFQLPEQIIPPDLIGEFVVDRVIASLGGKYKAIAKGGKFALQKVPGDPWGKIMKKIGETLFDNLADPNEPYRAAATDVFQPAIDSLRGDVFDWLTDVFKDIGLMKELGITVDFSPGAKTVLDFAGIDFHGGEEAAPSPSSQEHAPSTAGPLDTPSGGERLPPVWRVRAEASLGHDFSHVRLHQGAEGAAVTGHMHADAITSGSHVYLHPTVSPSGGGHGTHVLHHELGHVLQQTGSRPLGAPHDDAASAGRPGLGLTLNPAREAAAEQVADRAPSSAHAATPVDVGAPAQGAQPFMDRDFVKGMLERLRDPQRLKAEAIDVSPVTQFHADIALREDTFNRAIAERLPAKLIAAIKAMKPNEFQPPFDTIADKLKAIAASPDNEAHFAKAIKVLVASVRETKSKRQSKDDTAPEPAFWLNPERFAHELARYLYAFTGLAFEVSFAVKQGPEAIGDRLVIDLDAQKVTSARPAITSEAMHMAPFAALRVGHVHLPFLGDSPAAHDLWELLATNSFSSESGFTTEKELWIAATRLAVGHLLPKPGMYLQRKFELTALAKRSTRSQFTRIRPLKAHWPSPSDYAKDDSISVGDTSDPIAAHTGIRVGTFKTLEDERQTNKVEDRDPHHVPQVLLLDYFSNTHDKLKPFPELHNYPHVANLYPRVVASGSGEVSNIGPIQVAKYYAGVRADALPAILIAVHTHQAEIHVGTEPPDEKSKRLTMGGWVQRRFRESVGEVAWAVMRNRKSLDALRAAPSSTTVATPSGSMSSDQLGDKILAGARDTYNSMYVEMMAKLKRGLIEQEIPYYNLIAASKKGSPLTDAEKLKTTHVLTPYGVFEGTIDRIMTSSGFKV